MKSALEDLFRAQLRDWPMLARGTQGLAEAVTRQVRIEWFDVYIRHIPHRIASTTAAVDRASVEKRPCFLCAANLPQEEKGIAIHDDYTAYCNPYPILDRHLTIVHRDHRPQLIGGQIDAMLNIAELLPGYFVVYNGAECGASAPDHMHFQACSRALFPIEKDAAAVPGLSIPGYARNVIVLRAAERGRLADRLKHTVDVLGVITGKVPEPMINIALFFEAGQWSVFLFPRGKHRPAVFQSGELTVSPASIDLCGVFVVPVAADFERITGNDVASIFREVTLPDPMFSEALERLR